MVRYAQAEVSGIKNPQRRCRQRWGSGAWAGEPNARPLSHVDGWVSTRRTGELVSVIRGQWLRSLCWLGGIVALIRAWLEAYAGVTKGRYS